MTLGRLSALPVPLLLALADVPAAAQNQLWIRQLGTSATDGASAAAPDGSGGVYVSGTTLGSLGGPNTGGNDAWLARYDSAGNQVWIRQLGASNYDYANAAAPDGSGGVYVSGYTSGDLGGPNAGGFDAWLARYDSAGNQVWIRQLGKGSNDNASAAVPDGSGGVHVSGTTSGSFGGPSAGAADAWLAHYDSAGNRLWIRQLGTNTGDHAYAAAPDGSGGLYVSGFTDGSLGGPSAGAADAWLAHYDSAGNRLWIRQLGTNTDDHAYAAAPDGSGGLYVGGYTIGSLGGPNAGGYDAWVARYDGAGNQLWIRQLGTSSGEVANAAAPDGAGGLYVSGGTDGSLGGPKAGSYDVWLARYDSAGNQIWIHQLGTNVDDTASAAAPDGSGGVYVSGPTKGNFGGANAGSDDAWLARYDSLCVPLAVYCTAKTTSNGCVPSISATGTPSPATSGFVVKATNMINNKPCLLFYGTTGQAATPFQGGHLCVMAPLKRTPILSSGGNAPPNDCSGAPQIDMNCFAAGLCGGSPLAGLHTPGNVVRCQWWGRDPSYPAPNNTQLSNALEYTVCP
jgi:catechol 2,3-dioxygenase-like lactoylglutathione lyase family enzyme